MPQVFAGTTRMRAAMMVEAMFWRRPEALGHSNKLLIGVSPVGTADKPVTLVILEKAACYE